MSLRLIIFLVLLTISISPFAEAKAPTFDSGNYIEDVRNENEDIGKPLELMSIPDSIRFYRPINEKIFDKNLTLEFNRKYEDIFGRTEAEATYRDRGRIDYVEGPNGELVSVHQNSDKELEFGTFMFRRMAEYHFDNYSKTDENLRQVQEVKERVTNYEVSVAPGYSIKSNYSISGNYFDVNFNNPIAGARARLEMDPSQFGPTKIKEVRLAADRGLSRTVTVEAHYTVYDGIAAMITRKSLTPHSSVSLTGSTYFTTTGTSRRENLGLVGYGSNF